MNQRLSKISTEFLQAFWNENIFTKEFLINNLSYNVVYCGTIVGKQLIGINPLISVRSNYSQAFPNLKVQKLRSRVFRNCVVSEWNFSANHLGKFSMSVPPNSNYYKTMCDLEPLGNKISYRVEVILNFQNNKITKYQIHVDTNEIYRQLGVTFNQFQASDLNKAKATNSLIKLVGESTNLPLSINEAKALALHLAGFSSKQIGKIMNKSPRTIENQARTALEKLNFLHKAQFFEYLWYNGKIHIWQEIAESILMKKI